MEQLIVQQLCPGTPVVLIGCNGDNVPISTLARFIDVQARALKRNDPKIVVFDREGRAADVLQVAQQVKLDLAARGSPGNFVIGVADREFENWILAGLPHDAVCDFFTMHPSLVQEGVYGKSQIRKGMAKSTYQATIHGPALFKMVDMGRMAQQSSSAAVFISQLTTVCVVK